MCFGLIKSGLGEIFFSEDRLQKAIQVIFKSCPVFIWLHIESRPQHVLKNKYKKAYNQNMSGFFETLHIIWSAIWGIESRVKMSPSGSKAQLRGIMYMFFFVETKQMHTIRAQMIDNINSFESY